MKNIKIKSMKMKYYELVEEIKKLDLEGMEELKSIIEKILIYERRKEIFKNYKKSLKELKENRLRFFKTIKEMKKELRD